MELAFLYKIICGLSLYFAWGSYIFRHIIGFNENNYIHFFIYTAVGMLCFYIRGGWKRFVPLPLLGAVYLLFINDEITIRHIIYTLLPCMYIFNIVIKKRYTAEHSIFYQGFIKGTASLALLFGIAAILSGINPPHDTVFFIMLYLVCGVVLLRTLRQSEEIQYNPLFRFMNLSLVLLVVFTAFLLNSGVIGVILRYIRELLHRFVNYISEALAQTNELVMEQVSLIENAVQNELGIDVEYIPIPFFYLPNKNGYDYLMEYLGMTVLALPFIIFFSFIVWWLLSRQMSFAGLSNVEYSEIDTDNKKRNGLSIWENLSYRTAVRRYYRKYIRHFIKQERALKVSDTSEMISCIKEIHNANTLRDIYIRARYSFHTITLEDVTRSKTAYLNIIKSTKIKKGKVNTTLNNGHKV
jgi:hypothetical protein